MRPSSRDGFAIAIICALTLEAEVVEELFDETYDRLSVLYRKQPGDHNAYVNGRIGDHNVVLCYMAGMGKGNAASIASSLKISYKRIEVALVVGICGGAPDSSDGEIYLGDVIISDAVVEYDFGRQYPGGFKQKTDVKDTLGRPNREIRSLLAGLRAKQSRRDLQTKMLQHLQEIQESQLDYCLPTSTDDVLFEASFQHRHYSPTLTSTCLCLDETSNDVCEEALNTACTDLGCDEHKICRRRTQTEHHNPMIHIGTVASADTVMKSAEHRDNLVKSEGVIAFVLEDAGVWDFIPCIIIKGVCDYADSHRSKAWQPYAAATGAATAKAFLQYWPIVREEPDKFHIALDLTGVPAIEEFIGREDDLNHLWDYLQPASLRTQRVAVLHGLGGIGKTQLAIQFARKHKEDFTAVFWLSGKDRSALILSLSSCLFRILGQPVNNEAKNEEETEQRARQVLQWLARPGNPRWLIIFDNIDQYSPLPDPNARGYDIREFFPKADHGSIIITSRVQRLIEVGKSFPIGKLTRKDATQLLLQTGGFSAEGVAEAEQDIITIVNHLDGLSLAIVLAGTFMRETGTSMRNYLQLYKNAWSDLQSQSQPTRHYQQGNILETWMITYQEIQKRDPTAAKLLLLLACFDNRDIWYELIRGGLNCPDRPPWFETAVSNELAFITRIKILIEFSLVETNRQEGSYAIHPMVQAWCFHIAASEERTVQLYELALVSVGYMVPSNDERDYVKLQRRLLPHANHLIQRETYNWADDRVDIWKALNGLGDLYRDQGELRKAEEMYQRVLAGYEKVLGPAHTSTLSILNNFGNLYRDQGELRKAEEMYQRVLAGYEKVLGPAHTSTLSILNNFGNLYRDQGKLKEAKEMYERALVLDERVLSADDEHQESQQFENDSSDLSDSGSIVTDYSHASSISSTTTTNSSLDIDGIVVFTQGLLRTGNFQMLCNDALEEKHIQRDRLQRNLARILRVFASRLNKEDPDAQYTEISKFLRRYCSGIAAQILNSIQKSTIDSGLDESNIQQLSETDPSSRIEVYLKSTARQKQGSHPSANQKTGESGEKVGEMNVENLEQNDSASDHDSSGENSDSPSQATGNELKQAEIFLFKSNAFRYMEKQLFDFVHPSFPSILMNWVQKQRRHRIHSPEQLSVLEGLISELRFVHPTAIIISSSHSDSLLNRFKGVFEKLTGEEWDWWPLKPYMRALAKDEVRLFWKCPCGDARWAEVPTHFAKRIISATGILAASNAPQGQSTQTPVVTPHPAPTLQHRAGSSAQNHSSSFNSANSQLVPNSQSSHMIVGTSGLNTPLHVFLVMASRPMLEEYHILAQKEVSGMKNGQFFAWIRDNYYAHRGIWPSWFGLRVYSHCDFYKLRRFDGYEYAPLKPEYPGPQQQYYHFDPKPMESQPPIVPHQFYHWFYKLPGHPIGCRSLLHHPRRRPLNISSDNMITMLPKREMELEEGVSDTEDFWGLYIVERKSACKAAIWSFVLLLPCLGFFFAYFFKWGGARDLQNASVPLIILLGPLTTFWGNIFMNIGGSGRKQKLS